LTDLRNSMGTKNYLVSNILQNIFFCVQQKKNSCGYSSSFHSICSLVAGYIQIRTAHIHSLQEFWVNMHLEFKSKGCFLVTVWLSLFNCHFIPA